jgi:Mrp family chromosome partitioning ATPase
MIQQLVRTYDYVVLDSAPIMPVSDSVGLATMVVAVLIVAGASTARKLVRETCGRLAHVGAKILGVVLNRIDLENNSYQHYSYYNSYKPRRHQAGKNTPIGGIA